MKTDELFHHFSIVDRLNWNPDKTVRKITADSRSVGSGDVFVAVRGSRMDGHDFLRQAVLEKASVIVYETPPTFSIPQNVIALQVKDSRESLALLLNRFHGYPDKKIKLVGITGTNGKTTTAYLLHRLLREKSSAAYIGTLWYEFSGSKVPAVNTTPSAEVLIPLLAQMAEEGIEHCIIEVSSHALEQRRVHGLQFELGIFTQLSQDHLDYHHDIENYYQSKRRLFEGPPSPRKILTNNDCQYGERIGSGKKNVKTYSLGRTADFQAANIESSFQGSHFHLKFQGREVPFQIRLPLMHNVQNVVTVLSALSLLGFDPEDFKGVLQEIPGIPGRMERVVGVDAFQVFVDYAHTPDAVENVLSKAKELNPKRILTLLGCGGDRDRGKRPLMGQAASEYSDVVVLTSDNPRSEDPVSIIRDIREGISSSFNESGNLFEVLDRGEAIRKLISIAEPGDVLFILGKGHEDYQILGDRKIPFDDRLVVQECLKGKRRVFLS